MPFMFKRNRGNTMQDDLTEGEYEAAQDEDRVEEVPVLELDLERSVVVPDEAPFAFDEPGGVTVEVQASFNEFRKGDRLTFAKGDKVLQPYLDSGMFAVVD